MNLPRIIVRRLFFAFLLVSFPCSSAYADQNSFDRNKAAYLYNIFKLASFPEQPASLKQKSRVLCLLIPEIRRSAFQVIEHKQIDGEPLQVIYPSLSEARVRNCDIVFISDSIFRENENVIEQFHGLSVLTIGESEHFCQRGGIFNFYEDAGILRLELNLKHATDENIEIDPKLRRLARSVPHTASELNGAE